MRIKIPLIEARAIALRSQGLADDEAPFGLGKAGALKAIQQLGYVQVDTISVVERAHHHVLWSRVPDYEPGMLHELQSSDRQLYEYWNHAASYLPMNAYRFSRPLMRKYRSQLHWSDESSEIKSSMRKLKSLIRKNGPLMIGDVKSAGSVKGWTEGSLGKLERYGLHELWMRGEILIRSRKGMQKIFDLTERVLPAGTDVKMPSPIEAATFHVRRALRALGIARPSEMHYLQDAEDAKILRQALAALVKRGEAVEVEVEGVPGGMTFALADSLKLNEPIQRGVVRFLSPFDNLVIQRKRLKWLFDFDYTVEIYVPPAKRKYGYFVLPILWGDQMVGRMDVKAHRAERRLVVNRLVFEPGFSDFIGIRAAMIAALEKFTEFQKCDRWEIARVEPKSFGALAKTLRPRR